MRAREFLPSCWKINSPQLDEQFPGKVGVVGWAKMAESMLQLGEILVAGLSGAPKSRQNDAKGSCESEILIHGSWKFILYIQDIFFLVFRCSLVVRYALRNSLIPSSVLKMIFLFLELSAFPSPFGWPRRVKRSSGRNFRGAQWKVGREESVWELINSFGTLIGEKIHITGRNSYNWEIGCFFFWGEKKLTSYMGMVFLSLQDPIMNHFDWNTETHIF